MGLLGIMLRVLSLASVPSAEHTGVEAGIEAGAVKRTQSQVMDLKRLTEYDGARCLDGSPGSYYFSQGHGNGSSKFLLWMTGGGYVRFLS